MCCLFYVRFSQTFLLSEHKSQQMRGSSPVRVRTSARQFMPRAASATALRGKGKPSSPMKKFKIKKTSEMILVNKENYRLHNQCNHQSRTIKHLEERIDELKSENALLRSERDEQHECLKKIKAKLISPSTRVSVKQYEYCLSSQISVRSRQRRAIDAVHPAQSQA